MRFYFTLLLINTFLSFRPCFPLWNMNCQCTDFLQCNALISFTTEEVKRDIVNPFLPPNFPQFKYLRRDLEWVEPPSFAPFSALNSDTLWRKAKLIQKHLGATSLLQDDQDARAESFNTR